MLRAIEKDSAYLPLIRFITNKLELIVDTTFQLEKDYISESFQKLQEFFEFANSKGKEYLSLSAIDVLYSIARITIAVLLLEHAQWCKENNEYPNAIFVVKEWCKKDLTPFKKIENLDVEHYKAIIK